MGKNYNKIIGGVIAVLVILVGVLYFGDASLEYVYTGYINTVPNFIDVEVILMKNNHGNLLTYSTDIHNTDKKIVAGRLFYYKGEEKNVVLGNGLNYFEYSRKGEDKKEYGYDYIDNVLENDMYFDLCLDEGCNEIFETIKLERSQLR